MPVFSICLATSLAPMFVVSIQNLANIIEPQVGVLVETAEDERARRSAYPTTWPVVGNFTSGFGYRRSPFTRVWKFHSGIDISAPRGTKVRAGASGVVATAEYQGGYGKLVEIDHGYDVQHRKLDGWWKDTGKPDDLLETNLLVLQDIQGEIDETASIDRGPPT